MKTLIFLAILASPLQAQDCITEVMNDTTVYEIDIYEAEEICKGE